MGTTPGGLPYPENTGLVSSGDDDMKALATAVRYAGGSLTTASVAASSSVDVAITFPAGLFTANPAAVALAGNARLTPSVRVVSTSSVTIQFYNWTGSPSTAGAVGKWIAVQNGGPATVQAEALDAELEPVTVTCPTADCGNQGVPLTVPSMIPGEDGTPVPVGAYVCGPCGTELTSVEA